ncbi:MAG: hypothetical protein JNJ71_02945 [Rubrivivax sp.]|nr:hypothetical protein [Rubrivivax sp.]
MTTIAVARNLAGDGFGAFSLAITATLFLSNVHRATFTQPLNVLAATEARDLVAARLLALLKAHWLLLIPSAMVLAGVGASFFPDPWIALPAFFYFAAFALQETVRRYWYTVRELGKATVNDAVSYGGQLICVLALAHLDFLSPSTALLAMGATSLVAFFLGIAQVRPASAATTVSMRELARQHWPLSKWLILTVLALWGAGHAYPLLMVPLGAAAVAAYAASRNLLSALSLVVQSISNYIPSTAAATLQTEGLPALRRKVAMTSLIGTVCCAAFVAFAFAFALPVLQLAYGGRYDHAASDFGILAVGTACGLMGALFGAFALALGDSRSSFLANLGATLVTFTAGPWLISHHGVHGAAIAATLSLATAMLLQFLLLLYRLKTGPLKA